MAPDTGPGTLARTPHFQSPFGWAEPDLWSVGLAKRELTGLLTRGPSWTRRGRTAEPGAVLPGGRCWGVSLREALEARRLLTAPPGGLCFSVTRSEEMSQCPSPLVQGAGGEGLWDVAQVQRAE